jgi:hypothetical protein
MQGYILAMGMQYRREPPSDLRKTADFAILDGLGVVRVANAITVAAGNRRLAAGQIPRRF